MKKKCKICSTIFEYTFSIVQHLKAINNKSQHREEGNKFKMKKSQSPTLTVICWEEPRLSFDLNSYLHLGRLSVPASYSALYALRTCTRNNSSPAWQAGYFGQKVHIILIVLNFILRSSDDIIRSCLRYIPDPA